MKKVRLTTIMVMAFISLSAMSCKDAKTENSTNSEMITEEDHSKMNHDNSDGHHDVDKKEMAMNGDGNSQTILNDYFNLKDALVADDNAKAKELGATLATSLGKLDISKYTDAQQSELKDIMEDVKYIYLFNSPNILFYVFFNFLRVIGKICIFNILVEPCYRQKLPKDLSITVPTPC